MSLSILEKTRQTFMGIQMLFVAFGSLVLVPLLTGFDPSVALFTAGAGTLIFQLITRHQVPIFLASSFAFIAPIQAATQAWGISTTLVGLAATGLVYILLSFVVRIYGQQVIHRILPSVVIGPVIIVIGLGLAPVAINMLQGLPNEGQVFPYAPSIICGLIALLATMLFTLYGKGFMRYLSILLGILTGYFTAAVMTYIFHIPMLNMDAMLQSSWFAVPNFVMPDFTSPNALAAILMIVPVAIAPAVEHIGDMAAISSASGRNYLEKPGLKNTLLGDGLATSFAAMVGGPPNTTYSEVTGAVTLLKAFNPKIMTIAAITAILIAFVGKINGFLATIPAPVMGGIMVMLFGSIAVVGISTLVNLGKAVTETRNMLIIAIVLVVGIGGLELKFAAMQIGSIGLAAIGGIIANLLLPQPKN